MQTKKMQTRVEFMVACEQMIISLNGKLTDVSTTWNQKARIINIFKETKKITVEQR
jgi:hypothetical protein